MTAPYREPNLELDGNHVIDLFSAAHSRHELLFDTELTVAAWIKRERTGDCRVVDCMKAGVSSPGFGIDFHQNVLRFMSMSSYYSTSEKVAIDKWVHIAISFSSIEGKCHSYINGILSASSDAPIPLPHSNYDMYIGTAGEGRPYAGIWKGGIARFCMWNVALSKSEVIQVMNSRDPVRCGISETPLIFLPMAEQCLRRHGDEYVIVNHGILGDPRMFLFSFSTNTLKTTFEERWFARWTPASHYLYDNNEQETVSILMHINHLRNSNIGILPRELVYAIIYWLL